MAKDEHPFSNCQYSFLGRMLQPFQRNHLPQKASEKSRKSAKTDKTFSKSAINLNCATVNTEFRLSFRQIGNYVSEAREILPFISKPRIIGANIYFITFLSIYD